MDHKNIAMNNKNIAIAKTHSKIHLYSTIVCCIFITYYFAHFTNLMFFY